MTFLEGFLLLDFLGAPNPLGATPPAFLACRQISVEGRRCGGAWKDWKAIANDGEVGDDGCNNPRSMNSHGTRMA